MHLPFSPFALFPHFSLFSLFSLIFTAHGAKLALPVPGLIPGSLLALSDST
jgi:hypothetical protein